MDDVSVINWHSKPFGDCQLGFCTVDLSGRFSIVLKVLKSRAGDTYCAFCSEKMGDDWVSMFSIHDKVKERAFLDKCLEKLKEFTTSEHNTDQLIEY